MELMNQFLQTSAKLYKHLTEVPAGEGRQQYIDQINILLDERGEFIEELKRNGFVYDESNKVHHTLFELDKGIQERLNIVTDAVKADIKDFYNTKKHEIQYIDPYENLRNLDGRYYDGKK